MYRLVEITRVPTGPGKSWCFKSVLESPGFFCFFRKIVEKSRNFTQYLSDDFFFEVV